MSDSPGPNSLHPALAGALAFLAACVFFPSIVVWIYAERLPVADPISAAERVQTCAFWLIVALLIAEYLIARARQAIR